MAAATVGYDWPRSSHLRRTSDTVSSIYPGRPIHPLPKTSLRSKLSPEQARSIVYRPIQPISSPLFSFPYHQGKLLGSPLRQESGDRDHTCNCGGEHSELESEEEEDERIGLTQSSPGILQHSKNATRLDRSSECNSYRPVQSCSAPSSADGYESFENTNNKKKKRKIPFSGSANSHRTNLSAELANMGLSHSKNVCQSDDLSSNISYSYGSTSYTATSQSSGTGISGAGRGRFGRASRRTPTERLPLTHSTNGANMFVNNAPVKSPREWCGANQSVKGSRSEPGIISTAIANAAEQGCSSPQKGAGNISLLQQQTSKATPQKTQFTFTCASNSGSKIFWPGHSGLVENAPIPLDPYWNVRPPTAAFQTRTGVTQGTQTSPNMNVSYQSNISTPQQQQPIESEQPTNPKQASKNPRRRRAGQIYNIAANRRRRRQALNNYHHPPSREDIWICEFCEYESIFGSPPEALVRSYEIKDRKEQKRLEEQRRLLEKAKSKGRKGKKSSKKGHNSQGAQHSQTNQQGQRCEDQVDNINSPVSQIDGDYDEEFDLAPPNPSIQQNNSCSHGLVNGWVNEKNNPCSTSALGPSPNSVSKSSPFSPT